ncbi:MAG: hypothetical protein A2934_04295 [Candidatus Sungbacteria bacterium RIFCSPLOWO2_01_FULL_47_10]|uniref:Uncharacterized protein n=1 Tax=Candidatus Sungbacteria bacterium RIFCSPLOWO2_01_FULL_47_10 TaxID=1802276 RepID=A0A1G2KY03_9BACT|nr:MAG: hypothetical protein A2934_04295 [Candidatus Sungbacteria bacterium RIFCSPLOWO2_01_FULL_47_10]
MAHIFAILEIANIRPFSYNSLMSKKFMAQALGGGMVLLAPIAALAAVLPTTCDELLLFITDTISMTLAAFIGAISIVVLLVAAFQFLTAGGDSEKVTTARTTIMWAVVGLAVALLAFNIRGIVETFLGDQIPSLCA